MFIQISTVAKKIEISEEWIIDCDHHQVDGWMENATPPSSTPFQSSVRVFIVNISIIVCGGNHWALVNSRWQRCERVSNNQANKGPNSQRWRQISSDSHRFLTLIKLIKFPSCWLFSVPLPPPVPGSVYVVVVIPSENRRQFLHDWIRPAHRVEAPSPPSNSRTQRRKRRSTWQQHRRKWWQLHQVVDEFDFPISSVPSAISASGTHSRRGYPLQLFSKWRTSVHVMTVPLQSMGINYSRNSFRYCFQASDARPAVPTHSVETFHA